MTKAKGNSRSVQRQNWLTFSNIGAMKKTDDTTKHEDLNLVFANHGEEDEIYPLTIIEIAEAQKERSKYSRSTISKMLKHQKRGMRFQLIENTKVPCKEDK
jgi:hypothetical protein